jgi:hypothetical protein
MTADEPPIESLIDAVVALGGPLTSIVSHMFEFRGSGRGDPDAEEIPDVLRRLLREVLDPLRDEFSAGDILTGARTLDRVTDQICAEIFLVDPEEL